jgi:uroporphyrinogen decarboxylase
MTGRERVLAALNHQEPDRVAITDSPWGTTIERWHREGLPEGVGPAEYFGFEFSGAGFDGTLRLPAEKLEETDEYVIDRNADGAVHRNWRHATSTPECIDFRIKTRADWEEVKENAKFTPDRVDIPGVKAAQERANAEGKFFPMSAAFGYDRTQGVVGSERLLIAMAEDPEWCREMFMAWSELAIAAGEEFIGGGVQFDGLFMFDDNGYRNASLFSPAMFRDLVLPAHKMVYEWGHSHGLKSILHSCGRVSELIPLYIEAGLDCLEPLEVKAGMDLISLKAQFGDVMCFMGGIDVRKMADPDPRAIEQEIATKMPVAMKGGGYIYHSDHSVPDNISFAQYKHVMELVLQYGTY